MSHFKTLVFYIEINAYWSYQHHWFITIIIIIIILFYIRAYEDKNAARRLWILLVFEVFFVISESPPSFPSLVTILRLLDWFLLQTWCWKMSTSLGNTWLHKNSFYANLWLKWIYHQSTYCSSTSFFNYIFAALTFIFYFLFVIALLSICVIFFCCVVVLRWLWNKNICWLTWVLKYT